MNSNPLKQGVLTENSVGLGTVTHQMVNQRAIELALIRGGPGQEPLQSDWDRAKRELTGEPETDPKDALLESAPESERWDPVPGSTGVQAPAAYCDDEDEDGKSDSARLVEQGAREAEHDRMLKAAQVQGQAEK
jgi:hypothetical protein